MESANKGQTLCVECGEGVLDSDGDCPACGATDTSGLYTEREGMAAFNARVENTVQFFKEQGGTCLSVELDYVDDDEHRVLLAVFRRVAARAGLEFDAALDQYWVIQCWTMGGVALASDAASADVAQDKEGKMRALCHVLYKVDVEAETEAEAKEVAAKIPYCEWDLATDMTCCPCEGEIEVETGDEE